MDSVSGGVTAEANLAVMTIGMAAVGDILVLQRSVDACDGGLLESRPARPVRMTKQIDLSKCADRRRLLGPTAHVLHCGK